MVPLMTPVVSSSVIPGGKPLGVIRSSNCSRQNFLPRGGDSVRTVEGTNQRANPVAHEGHSCAKEVGAQPRAGCEAMATDDVFHTIPHRVPMRLSESQSPNCEMLHKSMSARVLM